MAELSKLLGFMSAWDRRDALQKYDALFCEAADVEELIAALGSPTKLAISLALNYVPSPAPVSIPVEAGETEKNTAELVALVEAELAAAEAEAAETLPYGDGPDTEDESPVSAEEAQEEEELYEAPARRKVRFFGLLVSIIFGLVIGLPIALLLICVGIPFIVSGLALAGGAVWAALTAIPMLALFSDILMVLGVGLVLCALGLLVAWFGLWVSFELGYLWISGVVLRLGRALTYKKEVAAE